MMAQFQWRESLSLDVAAIDADHKMLIDMLNRLNAMVTADEDRQAVGKVLWDLVQYTLRHFRREEMLMRLSGYPDYERHRRLHIALAARVAEYHDRYQAKPSRFDLNKLYDFMADWLLVHITTEDAKIRPFVVKLEPAKAA